jgi:hypothetical protein
MDQGRKKDIKNIRNTVKLQRNFYGKTGMSGRETVTQTQAACVETPEKWLGKDISGK